MGTYKTLEELEKARDGADLKVALKAAVGKVVTLKHALTGGTDVYVTGDIDKALVLEVTDRGRKKNLLYEFSLGVSGNTAYISRGSPSSFQRACRTIGLKLKVVQVSDVAAALRAARTAE
jgi:hypothetical protein